MSHSITYLSWKLDWFFYRNRLWHLSALIRDLLQGHLGAVWPNRRTQLAASVFRAFRLRGLITHRFVHGLGACLALRLVGQLAGVLGYRLVYCPASGPVTSLDPTGQGDTRQGYRNVLFFSC